MNIKRKILSVTGGATKFIQILISIKKVLDSGFEPTDILVKSSSAICILLIIMGKYDEAYKEGLNLDLNKYFTEPPTNGDGKLTFKAKLRAIWSFMPSWIGGDVNSFGVQDVRPLLKKYLTEELFQKYKNDNIKYPNIWVVSVKPNKSQLYNDKKEFTEYLCIDNLKDCENLEQALNLIEASSQIQAFTEGVEINNETRFDGGMYLAGSAGFFIEEGFFKKENVEELISIYSWTNPHFDIQDSKDWKKDIGTNTARLSQMFKASNKYFCAKHEYWLCKSNNIKRLAINVPDVFKNTYEVNPDTIKNAVILTNNYLNEIF